MRYLLLLVLLCSFSTVSFAQQTSGEGPSKFDACMQATASVSFDMKMPPIPKDAPDDYFVNLMEYYTVGDCVCAERSAEALRTGAAKWSCIVEFFPIPSKWPK